CTYAKNDKQTAKRTQKRISATNLCMYPRRVLDPNRYFLAKTALAAFGLFLLLLLVLLSARVILRVLSYSADLNEQPHLLIYPSMVLKLRTVFVVQSCEHGVKRHGCVAPANVAGLIVVRTKPEPIYPLRHLNGVGLALEIAPQAFAFAPPELHEHLVAELAG